MKKITLILFMIGIVFLVPLTAEGALDFSGVINTKWGAGAPWTDKDTAAEETIYHQWISSFDEADRKEWQSLMDQYNTQSTREGQVCKALDKLEALISHNESDISTWLPLEYDLQKTYGQENMAANPYFLSLRKLIDAWTDRKIQEETKNSDQQI